MIYFIVDSLVCHTVKAVDIIIWDEASMSSRRMFEVVNFIHHKLASDYWKNIPFSGKQMVLIGKFLQTAGSKAKVWMANRGLVTPRVF